MSRIFGPIDQICWLVPDIQTSMKHWAETLGVGPWFCTGPLRPEGFEYQGRPSDAEISIAIAYSGRLQIELIEQHNDAPSMYQDAIDAGRVPGQHHVGFFRRDYEERLEQALAAGYRIGQKGCIRGTTRFTYFTNDRDPGTIVELIDLTDPTEAAMVAMHQASLDWDGSPAPTGGGPPGNGS